MAIRHWVFVGRIGGGPLGVACTNRHCVTSTILAATDHTVAYRFQVASDSMMCPDLPPLDELTAVERRWLGMRLARLRTLAAMAMGTYAESVVAEALPGSLEAADGTARVDISWRPDSDATDIAVEVKHSRGGAWNVSERNAREDGVRVLRRRADVYVLADHSGPDHRTGWTFYVVPRWRLDGWGRKNLSASRLRNWKIDRVDAEALPAAIVAAAERPADYKMIIARDHELRRTRS